LPDALQLFKSMDRILIHVEGEAEESFVNEVLASHLIRVGFTSVSARLLGNARQRDRRGGIQGWLPSRKDLVRHLQEDANQCSALMVDYYALPQTGNKAWPGRYAAAQLPFHEKARMIEEALHNDIVATMGDVHPDRFIPFIMMHEFEGMLFSDCQRFGIGIGREDLVAAFQAIRDQFATPEEINDSSRTAPSKRILDLIPGYQKPLFGTLAALEIGLEAIRKECPHFDGWLTRLESLPSR